MRGIIILARHFGKGRMWEREREKWERGKEREREKKRGKEREGDRGRGKERERESLCTQWILRINPPNEIKCAGHKKLSLESGFPAKLKNAKVTWLINITSTLRSTIHIWFHKVLSSCFSSHQRTVEPCRKALADTGMKLNHLWLWPCQPWWGCCYWCHHSTWTWFKEVSLPEMLRIFCFSMLHLCLSVRYEVFILF